ncbi:hypothetical protein NQD34_011536 [Periophthalmus magnuspinnatus]|nr:hypothetical protein NQD34_011536 [Periophthalmus magnuspinnatus]
MSAACVLLLLALTLRRSEEKQLLVFSGKTVTLPCGDVPPTNCTWTKGGAILTPKATYNEYEDEGSSPVSVDQRSHRLNLSGSCELHIRDVTPEDAGAYICTGHNQSQPSRSFLSVVSFLGSGIPYSAKVSCRVHPYDGLCGFLVKLLVQGLDHDGFRVWTSECSAHISYSVSFPPSPLNLSVDCEVTDLKSDHVQVFPIFKRGNKTEVQTEDDSEESQDALWLVAVLMLVLRSVEVLMVSVVMVILLREYARRSSADDHQETIRQVQKNKNLNQGGVTDLSQRY